MKTYLIVWFSSEGTIPSEVNSRLLSMGFEAVRGNYDFVYNWGRRADLNQVLAIGDKVNATLKGTGVLYKIETIPHN